MVVHVFIVVKSLVVDVPYPIIKTEHYLNMLQIKRPKFKSNFIGEKIIKKSKTNMKKCLRVLTNNQNKIIITEQIFNSVLNFLSKPKH